MKFESAAAATIEVFLWRRTTTVMAEMAIGEHGIIGDLQTAALVATDGTVDWFCFPRFDSPSVFGALLDEERGGRFRIRPAGAGYTTKQMYFPDTAVLVTRQMEIVRLGEGVDRTGRINEAALRRTLEALRRYEEQIAAAGVSGVRMAATSATRDAENRAEFVAGVREILGVDPEVITPE